MRRRILWLDATANLSRTATRDGVRRIFDKARESGFTTVVVDVKPTSGEVLYPSRVAPRLRRWGSGIELAEDHDLLSAAVDAGRETGLEVFAGINVFVEGAIHDGRLRGAILADPRRASWEVVAYHAAGASLGPLTSFPGEQSAFVNPADPAVQQHELAIIEEIVAGYPVAGIVLDRTRYPGMVGDFSETTRRLLERYVGSAIRRWPQDVFTYADDGAPGALALSSGHRVQPGPYLGAWLELRANIIRQFMEAARARLKAVRPDALLGVYAGSWYPIYYELGVNWANPSAPRALELIDERVRPLIPAGYGATGYAPVLDLFLSGNYYPDVFESEAGSKPWWMTVQGAARLVSEVTGRVRPVYASLYLEQFRGRPEAARSAVQVCLEASDGVMLFDTCHIEAFGWWRLVKEALS